MSSFRLDQPAVYRITIHGCLGSDWSESFADMDVCSACETDGTPLTVLTGCVADQAALYGVLNGLYSMGFTLLAVELMSYEPTR